MNEIQRHLLAFLDSRKKWLEKILKKIKEQKKRDQNSELNFNRIVFKTTFKIVYFMAKQDIKSINFNS